MRLRPSDCWFWENWTPFLCFGHSFWTFKKQVLANPLAFRKAHTVELLCIPGNLSRSAPETALALKQFQPHLLRRCSSELSAPTLPSFLTFPSASRAQTAHAAARASPPELPPRVHPVSLAGMNLGQKLWAWRPVTRTAGDRCKDTQLLSLLALALL